MALFGAEMDIIQAEIEAITSLHTPLFAKQCISKAGHMGYQGQAQTSHTYQI